MKEALRQQFGAAIDALAAAVRACPDVEWVAGERWHQPWYIAYHTVFWLDYYLAEADPAYRPPAPFTLGELEADAFPEHEATRAELLEWLQSCRAALAARLSTLPEDGTEGRPCRLGWGTVGAVELLLYNLRHVQHHTGQLNLLVRRSGHAPPPWILRADGLGRTG
jgi:hypothetical protein